MCNSFEEIVNKHGVENRATKATGCTHDIIFLGNLVHQYILVKVAKLRRCCLSSKEVLEG